jgi:hypothetical protein
MKDARCLCRVSRYFHCYAEYSYPKCHYADCHYADCHYTDWHYADCHYADCCYADCCGAQNNPQMCARTWPIKISTFYLSHTLKSINSN